MAKQDCNSSWSDGFLCSNAGWLWGWLCTWSLCPLCTEVSKCDLALPQLPHWSEAWLELLSA